MRKLTWILTPALLTALVIGLLSFSCASPHASTLQSSTVQPTASSPAPATGGEIKIGVKII